MIGSAETTIVFSVICTTIPLHAAAVSVRDFRSSQVEDCETSSISLNSALRFSRIDPSPTESRNNKGGESSRLKNGECIPELTSPRSENVRGKAHVSIMG